MSGPKRQTAGLGTVRPPMDKDHQRIHSSQSIEWYTPRRIIEAARAVMATIDLDPASCDLANRTVQAPRYFTKDDDGLSREWCGNVWLNPPYGRINGKSAQGLWSAKCLTEFQAGRINQAVLLVNAATGEQWFQRLWDYPVCFTRRIKFYNAEGEQGGPTHGNALVYLGPLTPKFIEVASGLGTVVMKVDRDHAGRARKQASIREWLTATPKCSDRHIARALGVSHPTVSTVRRVLEDTGQLVKATSSIGADGKTRPRLRVAHPLAANPSN